MSRTLLARPSYLHAASRVSSASSESGLAAGPAVADSTNAGQLVIRSSGVPYAAASIVARLHTGGNPTGYALPGVAGRARGAGLTWRNSTDAVSLNRGYTDTPYLVRVAHPIGYGANHAPTSTPRELSDGYLGVFLATTTAQQRFYRIASDWSQSSVEVSTLSLPSINHRVDFCILPSGRLVAAVGAQGGQDGIQTYYSDDDGATWAALGYSAPGILTSTADVLCIEAVGDDVVLLQASRTGARATRVLLSHDGGATFTSVDTATTLTNPRTCVRDGIVLATTRSATLVRVVSIAPGGGCSSLVATTANTFADVQAIACRDDGVLWALGWNAANTTDQDMEISASLDGGLTWADATADPVADLEQAAYATSGMDALSAGTWRGAVIAIGRANSNLGSDGGLHFLQFGEWANVTDGFGGATAPEVYQHSYWALGYPQEFGWTRTDLGAGCTLTNQPYLNMTGGAGVNSDFRSSGAWWTTAATDSRKVRARLRINSGGNLGADEIRIKMAMDDGANTQIVTVRFTTTGARMVDHAGTIIGASLTDDLTAWTDFIFAFAHDAPSPGGAGRVTAWYKQDADATYTLWQADQSVPEQAGAVTDSCSFGGTAGGNVNWDLAYLASSESTEGQHDGQTNPADLSPWPLAASYDIPTTQNVRLGGLNGGGIPGDVYTVATTYSRGKEQIWRELRPSRYWATSADKTAANIVLDAGAGNEWDIQVIAVLGTNYRTATLEANATDAWGGPSFSVGLDATTWEGIVGAATRGPGYIGPARAPGWRDHQYRSDGDAHRWFLEVGAHGAVALTVYEISDNDDGRIYVEDADFSAVTAGTTIRVFGDRMAVRLPSRRNFRFARLSIGSQDTIDGHYRTGTIVIDRPLDLSQLYEHGFVDRVEPRVTITEATAGYRSTLREGPRRHVLACQWGPIDRRVDAVDLRLADFFAALDGQPFLLWRDVNDPLSVGLYQYAGAVAMPNLLGEHEDNLGRVEQVVLEEVW